MSARIIAIAGTDTGVGKTFFGCALSAALTAAGHTVIAIKPVETGCEPGPQAWEDGVQLAKATGQESPRRALQTLRNPLAPPDAAKKENAVLFWDTWVSTIRSFQDAADIILVEGAGGLLSPVAHGRTLMDLALEVDAEIILVASDKLGTQNHVLLSLKAMEAGGLECSFVVFSEPETPDTSTGINEEAIAEAATNVRTYSLPRYKDWQTAAESEHESLMALVGQLAVDPQDVPRVAMVRAVRQAAGSEDHREYQEWLLDIMNEIDARGHRRERVFSRPTSLASTSHDSASMMQTQWGKDRVTLFSTNDYLGLSGHPTLRHDVEEATRRYGMGPRSSAMICGSTFLHETLETRLAALEGKETAMLFPTGYAANVSVLTALAGPSTTIHSDSLNHASIIDGCRLAARNGATLAVYPHKDMRTLEENLESSKTARNLIVTDSVFSMDGDLADLEALARLKRRHSAMLVIDEAHATLVFGEKGAGLSEATGTTQHVDVVVGTLSKAFGAHGGFVATNSLIRDVIMHRARPMVYSTSLPIPVVAAALSALDLANDGSLRKVLWSHLGTWQHATRQHLHSPIIPVILGGEDETMRAAAQLLGKGFHVGAIRPPTVEPGRSRLRISLSAAHRSEDIQRLLDALDHLKLRSV